MFETGLSTAVDELIHLFNSGVSIPCGVSFRSRVATFCAWKDKVPHIGPGPDLSVLDVLSVREKDVFLLASKGLSNAEMAQSLFVSETTVKTHLRSVLDKLKLGSRLQLVAFAYENKLLG